MKPLHVAADSTRIARIKLLVMGGRLLAAQKAILRTMTRDERR
jgi:hypothetical protein